MKINNLKYNTEGYHESLKLYIEDNPLYELIDTWFKDNKIGELEIASKAWNTIKNAATKIIAKKIATYFEVPEKSVRFSRKCGCSCGCSPGFNVRFRDNHPQRQGYTNASSWININEDISEEDIYKVQKIMNGRAIRKLELDRIRHQEVIAKRTPAPTAETTAAVGTAEPVAAVTP